jgi:uncharacterized protein (TIGR02145 family)
MARVHKNKRRIIMKTNSFLSAAISIALASTFFGCGEVEGSYNLYGSSSSSDDSSSATSGVSSSSGLSSSEGSSSSSSAITDSSSSSSLADAGSSSSSTNDGFIGCKDPDETVTIGTQTWLKCNLNVEHNEGNGNSWCYEGSDWSTESEVNITAEEGCAKYGRLYDWAASVDLPSKCNNILSTNDPECAITSPNHQGICPDGFHIPSAEDWTILMDFAGHLSSRLKSESGWYPYPDEGISNTDEYGFSALPGGHSNQFRVFFSGGFEGHWWSSTEEDSYGSYSWGMNWRENYARRYVSTKRGFYYSIRCLKD